MLTDTRQTIARHNCVIIVERLETPKAELEVPRDVRSYRRFRTGLNIPAIHSLDPAANHVHQPGSDG